MGTGSVTFNMGQVGGGPGVRLGFFLNMGFADAIKATLLAASPLPTWLSLGKRVVV